MAAATLLLLTTVFGQLDQALCATHAGRNICGAIRPLVVRVEREWVRTAQGRLFDVLGQRVITHIEVVEEVEIGVCA